MLKSEDPKIKLRAISLILRHADKVRTKDDDKLLDEFLESLRAIEEEQQESSS
ncbi:MAG: hypothetical protein NZ826_05055 [Thermodesulfovibrio sp.]|nr:hypothetical protein [Thermodesulfovibrio sp.]